MTTRLEAEIREQPEALARLLDAEGEAVAALGRGLAARDVRGGLLVARGSSDNAARYGQYVLGIRNGLPVALAAPSVLSRYGRSQRLDGFLAIAISQSGRSPDVVAVVDDARRQGCPTVALTNAPESPLARAAEHVVDLRCGAERSVAATKTYTASLLGLALLSAALDGDGAGVLETVPERVAGALEVALRAVTVPAWLAQAGRCAVVGRGYHYGTAFEIALKVKELTGIAAEAYSPADFLHGPIAASGPDCPAVLVAPSGAVTGDVADLVEPLRARRTRLLVLSDVPEVLERADEAVPLPGGTPEWLAPLTSIVPGQVLAWRLATTRGLDVDRPHGLTKVTETE